MSHDGDGQDGERQRVLIFDTTLRDGEQSPGCSMNMSQKLRMARALARLGVDVIEAGFPVASPGDFEAVRAVAAGIRGPIVAGLARCVDGDIDRAWEAIQPAERPRLHLFLATSSIHREYKLRMAEEEIVRRTRESVARAREYCDDVEFSPEDASRTEPDFLIQVLEAAVEAGATTLNIPDTVGYALPEQFGRLIGRIREQVRGIDGCIVSVHCHDDLGMAVANSLAAVRAGARQVECTVNGIGERAGNASLEELVMALRTRRDFFGLDTEVETSHLYPTSRLLSHLTGMEVQRNKAVVGENAFAHEAGIHQHGVLMNRATYEIMRPQDVGFSRSQLVLGKHSGRHAFRDRVEKLGFEVSDRRLDEAFADFKKLADDKKEVEDADIVALMEGCARAPAGRWEIVDFQAMAGTGVEHLASVRLRQADGDEVTEAACGEGPVDAVFRAVNRLTGVDAAVTDYRVRSVAVGADGRAEVGLEIELDGEVCRGHGTSSDVIEASARAYLHAVNLLVHRTGMAPIPEPAGERATVGPPRGCTGRDRVGLQRAGM